MKYRCLRYLLLFVFVQLFVFCTNNKIKEEVKENRSSIANTIDNVHYIAIIDSSDQKKENANNLYIVVPPYYDFIGDNEIKVMICDDKKTGIRDLDSVKILYGNEFPYAKDSIEVWWNQCK